MRRSRLTLRHMPIGGQLFSVVVTRSKNCPFQTSSRNLTALVRPSAPSSTTSDQNRASSSRNLTFTWNPPRYIIVRRLGHLSHSSRWKAEGRLGQASTRRAVITPKCEQFIDVMSPVRTALEEFEMAVQRGDSESWGTCVSSIRRYRGSDGVWELFELIQKNGHLRVLARHDMQLLRDEILSAALVLDSRLNILVDAAYYLLSAAEFRWPDLYMKVVHHMLDHGLYEKSLQWHLHLTPRFPPSKEIFGALLSSFVVDPSPNMQSNLTALYVSSTEKNLYDHIVPVLFAAGLSKLARAWRKKLLIFGDSPMTSKSKPFLQFLATFYPTIILTKEELEVGGVANKLIERDNFSPAYAESDPYKGQYGDAIVARWFASSWTSVEFAINLAQRLGLRSIGPRSLQSLALREPESKTVASRIGHIEKLGIDISTTAYCKALVFFAKHGEEELLAALLACDVHPDEFDDIETRQMLMASSVREQDWQMEKLLQGIEWAIESDPSARRLNALLESELSKRKLDKAKQVLDRMEALKVNMSQESAVQLLRKTFQGLGKHPMGRKRQNRDSRDDLQSRLNRAVDVTRRVALHDVAIPLEFWSLLLYNLGRLGRFSELGQLSMEIVQLYTPPLGGLVPVHAEDLPHIKHNDRAQDDAAIHRIVSGVGEKRGRCHCSLQRDNLSSNYDGNLDTMIEGHNELWNGPVQQKTHQNSFISESGFGIEPALSNDKISGKLSSTDTESNQYIPADLPFSHRQHPIQKLFNSHLQRSIVRWGFDQTLKTTPSSMSIINPTCGLGVSAFDVASGVRLLALLRDQGVLIDSQILRATVMARIALGQIPGRQKDRSRDRHELSMEYMKGLFDEAWGSEILPSPSEIARHLEHQKPKLWSRYPKLFGRSFDDDQRGI